MASVRIPLLILGIAVFLCVVNACTYLEKGLVYPDYPGHDDDFFLDLKENQKNTSVHVFPPDLGSTVKAVKVRTCLVAGPSLVSISYRGGVVYIERFSAADPWYPLNFKITVHYAAAIPKYKDLEDCLIGYTDGVLSSNGLG